MEEVTKLDQGVADHIRKFIDEGGRFDEKEKPSFGEPFYGLEMMEKVADHCKVDDEVSVRYKDADGQEHSIHGIIMQILPRNVVVEVAEEQRRRFAARTISVYYEWIIEIKREKMTNRILWAFLKAKKRIIVHELLQSDDASKDLKEAEEDLKKYFNAVFPDKDFSNVMVLTGTHALFWPFHQTKVSCEMFLYVKDEKAHKIKCDVIKEGDFFCIKNHNHADMYKNKMVMYLNNKHYDNVYVSVLWTVECHDDNGKPMKLQLINIVHADNVREVIPDKNVYEFDSITAPYIGLYKSELKLENPKVWEYLMTLDAYLVLLRKTANGYVIKYPDGDHEARFKEESRLMEYMDRATMTYLGYDKKSSKRYDESICPVVEVLCERYSLPESGSGNSDFFDFHGRTW